MNVLIELGILVIALGSYLVYLGNKKDNDKSQQVIIDKINAFNAELTKVQSDTSTDLEKVFKIDELTNEFDSWATDLKENYPEIKLSYNKSELEFSEKELKINKEWRPFYLDIFKNIEKMINSINKSLSEGNKIVLIKNDQFPQSIFKNNEDINFNYILKFDDINFWKIDLYRFHFTKDNSRLPTVTIEYTDDIKKIDKHLLTNHEFIIRNRDGVITHETNGIFKLIDTSKFSENISIENINEILKTCIQYQLTKINHLYD